MPLCCGPATLPNALDDMTHDWGFPDMPRNGCRQTSIENPRGADSMGRKLPTDACLSCLGQGIESTQDMRSKKCVQIKASSVGLAVVPCVGRGQGWQRAALEEGFDATAVEKRGRQFHSGPAAATICRRARSQSL